MNYRKHKQSENQKKKRTHTPEGYITDPPDAVCPYCDRKWKSCSYVNSVSRAWARNYCAKKNSSKS